VLLRHGAVAGFFAGVLDDIPGLLADALGYELGLARRAFVAFHERGFHPAAPTGGGLGDLDKGVLAFGARHDTRMAVMGLLHVGGGGGLIEFEEAFRALFLGEGVVGEEGQAGDGHGDSCATKGLTEACDRDHMLTSVQVFVVLSIWRSPRPRLKGLPRRL